MDLSAMAPPSAETEPEAEPAPSPSEQADSGAESSAPVEQEEAVAAEPEPEDPPVAAEPASPPVQPAVATYDDVPEEPYSSFDAEPPFRPRRNWLKLWTWAAGIFALFAAAIIFAVSYWGLPDWVPVSKPLFAPAQAELVLDFPLEQQEKRELPNGTEYFMVRGSITNVSADAQDVPKILIILRDARDRIVYSWEIDPGQRSIGPGQTITVSKATTEVPRSAQVAEIGWKPS